VDEYDDSQAENRTSYKPRHRCLTCGRAMTWRDVRIQWGRLKNLGIEDTKSFLPRCQKCITRRLAAWEANQEATHG
jgi:hypothetical protein